MQNRKKLKDILEGIEIKSVDGTINADIYGITTDSKAVKENFIFIAVKGGSYDGHDFIKEAIEKGAKAVIAQEDPGDIKNATKIIVSDSRKALAEIAHKFFDKPAAKARVIGITGTNGKTTISYLAESVLKLAGFNTGVIGTVNYRYGSRQIPATNTTPGALQLVEILNGMVTKGVNSIVMEVSSHSLEQHRVWGIDFKTAVFTNITPEHLDYHKNMHEYKNAKAKLFERLSKQDTAVLNIDDEFGKELVSRVKSQVLTYGFTKDADIRPESVSFTSQGIELKAITPAGKLKLHSKLSGRFNLYNILATIGIGISEKIALDKIAAGIQAVEFVPGRLQEISCGQPFKVYVDYAHTDDALKNVLTVLRELTRGKIITLFGCGGNRDTFKRPRMGKVASELSDYVIITTDNPRSESPQDIAEEVIKGVPKNKLDKTYIILDRQEAIKKAISLAEENDTVLLAGKGHETYQIFKNMVQQFDDREIVKKILVETGHTSICSR